MKPVTTQLISQIVDDLLEEGEVEPLFESKFSTLLLPLSGVVKRSLMQMSVRIPDKELFLKKVDGMCQYGREDEPHVTVKYGLHTKDGASIRRVVSGFGSVRVSFERSSIFLLPRRGYEVVKVGVVSKDLRKLNKIVCSELACTDTFKNYRPHVTIAYVKAGFGKKYRGMDDLTGRVAVFDHCVFSTPDREKTLISFM